MLFAVSVYLKAGGVQTQAATLRRSTTAARGGARRLELNQRRAKLVTHGGGWRGAWLSRIDAWNSDVGIWRGGVETFIAALSITLR